MRRWIVVALAVTALASASSAQKKPDDEAPKNLKVLPRHSSRKVVFGIMRGYASSLGVNCAYCHVEGADGHLDFAKDDKRTKRVARQMIRMVRDINTRVLDKIEDRPTPIVQVGCVTCHRAVARPKPLGQVMLESMAAGGLDSARRAYKRLHDDYYGRAAYDFGEPSLTRTAVDLIFASRYDDALKIMQLNGEQFPTSSNVPSYIGDVHLAMGDTTAALADYEKALARDSTNNTAKFRLHQLGRLP
jgi:tetratricopeptide (TPR) repeat protein